MTDMAPLALSLEGVRKKYGPTVALDGISLGIAEGELFGLLGPNGAGKTTLMSILAGLLPADGGRVSLFAEPFSPASRNRRRLVGLATQDLAVYPELSAEENLMFFGRLYGMGGEELTDRVAELLATVGLSDRARHRVGNFSGGMKRRLNLAVAVVHRPRLILLDEPTTGVDPQSRNHIFDLVRSLNAAGLTVIYTSHYMEEVQALCPRIAILDHGRVQACDTLPALLGRLDATAEFGFDRTPTPQLLESAKCLPGVKAVAILENRLLIHAADVAPILPRLVRLCDEAGHAPARIKIVQPTLERVFLSLTGRQLRD